MINDEGWTKYEKTELLKNIGIPYCCVNTIHKSCGFTEVCKDLLFILILQ